MAEAGAKVLNAQAVEFAKEKGIAIYARATSGPLPGPDPSSDGTVVRKSPPRMPGTVVGVASERDVIVLERDVAAADLLALLDERGVAGKQLHVFGGQDPGRHLAREPARRGATCATRCDARFSGRARLVDGLAAVSVVGAGINATLRERPRRHRRRSPQAGISRRRHRHLVVPDHLDGPARPHGRRRPAAARAVHRIGHDRLFPDTGAQAYDRRACD